MDKPSAIKVSLFAAEEREQKLDKKVDLLMLLEIGRTATRPINLVPSTNDYITMIKAACTSGERLMSACDEY